MDNSSLRILVVEDDDDARRNLQDILELDEHRVEAVGTGREAVAYPMLAQVEVVLLDRRLPDATAEQVLPKLQSANPEAEVIIITGHADIDSALSAMRHGATDYLLKPINSDALRMTLRRLAERRRLAKRVVEAERLAAIGEAMAGLTHESRNALARSQANLRRLSRRLKDRPELLELIEAALAAQDDVQRLFEDVRQYAAPLRLRCEETDIRQLILEAWDKLALERAGRDARLFAEPNGIDLICQVDCFTLRNAFRNILENALAACEDPMRLEVTFQAVQLGGFPALQVSLCDNGPGFPPETVDSAFKAFHTTKTHGTGLGLAIVKRTVEEHGGRVALGTSPAQGAEIILTLPRTNG
jgi:signal transduction histidine kinase